MHTAEWALLPHIKAEGLAHPAYHEQAAPLTPTATGTASAASVRKPPTAQMPFLPVAITIPWYEQRLSCLAEAA